MPEEDPAIREDAGRCDSMTPEGGGGTAAPPCTKPPLVMTDVQRSCFN